MKNSVMIIVLLTCSQVYSSEHHEDPALKKEGQEYHCINNGDRKVYIARCDQFDPYAPEYIKDPVDGHFIQVGGLCFLTEQEAGLSMSRSLPTVARFRLACKKCCAIQ